MRTKNDEKGLSPKKQRKKYFNFLDYEQIRRYPT